MKTQPKKKHPELTTEQRIQLESVATMNVPTLRQKYLEVFGEESKSNNAAYLRKRIVWRIQEKALGGLSERVKQRLLELGQEAPFRYRGGPLASFSTAADRLTDGTVVVSATPAPAPALAPQPALLAPALTPTLAPALACPPAAAPPAPLAPLAPPAGPGAAPPAPPLAPAAPPAAVTLVTPAPGALQAPALVAPAGLVRVATPAPGPVPWLAAAQPPALPQSTAVGATSPGHLQLATTPAGPTEERDPRLPPPGTLLKRVHNGLTHTVQVLPSGFLYNGQPYASLSKLARAITGSNWNGFTFFGLTRPWKSEDAA
jgi:hypothetical protein